MTTADVKADVIIVISPFQHVVGVQGPHCVCASLGIIVLMVVQVSFYVCL